MRQTDRVELGVRDDSRSRITAYTREAETRGSGGCSSTPFLLRPATRGSALKPSAFIHIHCVCNSLAAADTLYYVQDFTPGGASPEPFVRAQARH